MSGMWKNLPEVLRPRRSAVMLMDKSAIQAVSVAEMDVLSLNNIYLNVPPVLLGEILSNVAKTFRDGRDPVNMVRSLAAKVGGLHGTRSTSTTGRPACPSFSASPVYPQRPAASSLPMRAWAPGQTARWP